MWLIILGPPGSGKGTQATRVAESLCIPHVSTGEMLRAAREHQSELGQRVAGFLDAGKLVPDDVMVELVEDRLSQPDCGQGVLLDGFPRTVEQAQAIKKLLAAGGRELHGVINLRVDDQEVTGRLLKRAELEGRSDDTLEVIQERMNVYHRQTEPLIDFYADRGKLIDIDGTGTPEEVSGRIQDALKSIPSS